MVSDTNSTNAAWLVRSKLSTHRCSPSQKHKQTPGQMKTLSRNHHFVCYFWKNKFPENDVKSVVFELTNLSHSVRTFNALWRKHNERRMLSAWKIIETHMLALPKIYTNTETNEKPLPKWNFSEHPLKNAISNWSLKLTDLNPYNLHWSLYDHFEWSPTQIQRTPHD